MNLAIAVIVTIIVAALAVYLYHRFQAGAFSGVALQPPVAGLLLLEVQSTSNVTNRSELLTKIGETLADNVWDYATHALGVDGRSNLSINTTTGEVTFSLSWPNDSLLEPLRDRNNRHLICGHPVPDSAFKVALNLNDPHTAIKAAKRLDSLATALDEAARLTLARGNLCFCNESGELCLDVEFEGALLPASFGGVVLARAKEISAAPRALPGIQAI